MKNELSLHCRTDFHLNLFSLFLSLFFNTLSVWNGLTTMDRAHYCHCRVESRGIQVDHLNCQRSPDSSGGRSLYKNGSSISSWPRKKERKIEIRESLKSVFLSSMAGWNNSTTKTWNKWNRIIKRQLPNACDPLLRRALRVLRKEKQKLIFSARSFYWFIHLFGWHWP